MGFLKEDFMLRTPAAVKLYEQFAKNMPIYDYHCHLSAKEIAENRKFTSATEAWLEGDHYKWRAMRTLGIEEYYITGEASDKEKFMAWIKAVPLLIGNPLYHWTHLELARYFDYHEVVKEKDVEKIWNHCEEIVRSTEFTTQSLIKQSNVSVICTINDPLEDLSYHVELQQNDEFPVKVLPTFRPDAILHIQNQNFSSYIQSFLNVSSDEVTVEALVADIDAYVEKFHEAGCRLADHGLTTFTYVDVKADEVNGIIKKRLEGAQLSIEEEHKYVSLIMQHLSGMYARKDWAMQLHLGPIRNNNTLAFKTSGPDSGYDSISNQQFAEELNKFFDALNVKGELPRTIVFPLNPTEQEAIASTLGNFQQAGIKGKMQLGTAWWFNDHKEGMLRQMNVLANYGVISTFIGMLTDSRSFLSYARHEYFRRILCDLFGQWMEAGEIPDDLHEVGGIIEDICYNNAANYFTISNTKLKVGV